MFKKSINVHSSCLSETQYLCDAHRDFCVMLYIHKREWSINWNFSICEWYILPRQTRAPAELHTLTSWANSICSACHKTIYATWQKAGTGRYFLSTIHMHALLLYKSHLDWLHFLIQDLKMMMPSLRSLNGGSDGLVQSLTMLAYRPSFQGGIRQLKG
jgi:hypothetical protein